MVITTAFAGLLGLIYIVLAVNVIRTRRASDVSLGHNGDKLLERRIRAHGNFAEYVPIALLLMAFPEAGGASIFLIYVLGIALVVGRLMHAFALSSLTLHPVARVGGMALTLTVIGVVAVACLVTAAGFMWGPSP